MSNPLTQKSTATEKDIGIILNSPLTAKYDPIGARESHKPKIKWQRAVNRLV